MRLSSLHNWSLLWDVFTIFLFTLDVLLFSSLGVDFLKGIPVDTLCSYKCVSLLFPLWKILSPYFSKYCLPPLPSLSLPTWNLVFSICLALLYPGWFLRSWGELRFWFTVCLPLTFKTSLSKVNFQSQVLYIEGRGGTRLGFINSCFYAYYSSFLGV